VGFSSNLSSGHPPELTPDQEYDIARAAGANAQRVEVFWSQAEPSPPRGGVHAYAGAGPEHGYIDALDARYAAMLARGLKPLLILHSAPFWAQPHTLGALPACARECWQFVEPADGAVADWAAFAAFVASRYPQAAFEIWNEPNLAIFYKPAPDPGRYLRLYREAYASIKAVRPDAEVVTGGLASPPTTNAEAISGRDFLGALYAGGIEESSPDFRLGMHTYPGGLDLGANSGYAGQWDYFADVLEANGDLGREVWVTETGSRLPPAQQHDVMRRAYARMTTMDTAGSRRLDVRAILFHTLKDDRGFGFLAENLAPKPAYCWMVNAAPPSAPRSLPAC
jgi:polysaccharide biosynthesis protein PslG